MNKSQRIQGLILLISILLLCLVVNIERISTLQPPKPAPTTLATLPPTNAPTLTPSPSPTPTPSATATRTPTTTTQPTETATATEAATIAPTAVYTPILANPVATVTMTPKQAKIAEYWPIFVKVAKRFGLDPYLLAEQAWAESRLNPSARGKANEMGSMQIMPATWDYTCGPDCKLDPFDIEDNLTIAVKLLLRMRKLCIGWGDDSEGCMVLGYAVGEGAAAEHYEREGSWISHPFAWYIWELFEGVEDNKLGHGFYEHKINQFAQRHTLN